jgi:hypothetical protein
VVGRRSGRDPQVSDFTAVARSWWLVVALCNVTHVSSCAAVAVCKQKRQNVFLAGGGVVLCVGQPQVVTCMQPLVDAVCLHREGAGLC